MIQKWPSLLASSFPTHAIDKLFIKLRERIDTQEALGFKRDQAKRTTKESCPTMKDTK